MEKKAKGGLGIEMAYKRRSGVLFLLRGNKASLQRCIEKYGAFLSANEITGILDAVGALDKVISNSGTVYDKIMKPQFIHQANETRQEEASSASSAGHQEPGATDVQSGDGSAQGGSQG